MKELSSPSLRNFPSETNSEEIPVTDFNLRNEFLALINKMPNMYLGLPQQYEWLLNHIVEKSKIKTSVLCLIITLFKIKQNDTFYRICDQFQITRPKMTTFFHQGIEVLANFFQNFVFLPSVIQIKRNLPLVFKLNFSNLQMIIDCFEMQIEKPTNPLKQSQTWSQYKSCNTLKYLIGCTPSGFVTFISKGYGGRISDKALVEKSGLIDCLPTNAVLLADRGFKEIESALAIKNIKLLRPPSVYANQRPSREEVLKSKTIASLRIHVERVIRRIREFKMLKPHFVINHKHVGYMDQIVIIACGLINLQDDIIKK